MPHILNVHPTIQRQLDIKARRAQSAAFRKALATVESTTVRPDGTTVLEYVDAGRPPLLAHPGGSNPRNPGFRSSTTPRRLESIDRSSMVIDCPPSACRHPRTFNREMVALAQEELIRTRRHLATHPADQRAEQVNRESQALAWLHR